MQRVNERTHTVLRRTSTAQITCLKFILLVASPWTCGGSWGTRYVFCVTVHLKLVEDPVARDMCSVTLSTLNLWRILRHEVCVLCHCPPWTCGGSCGTRYVFCVTVHLKLVEDPVARDMCSVTLSTLNLWRILWHEICVLWHCPPWTCGGSWGTRYVFCVTVHLKLVEDPVARDMCSVTLSTLNLWRILRHKVRVLCHCPPWTCGGSWGTRYVFCVTVHLEPVEDPEAQGTCSVSLSTLNLWRILRHEVRFLWHCPPWTCGGSWGTRYVFCVTVHLELVEDPEARGTCSVSLSTLNLWRILRHEICVLWHGPPWTCGGSWGTRYVFCDTVHLEPVEDPEARGTCSVSLSTLNLWRILWHEVCVLCHCPPWTCGGSWGTRYVFCVTVHLELVEDPEARGTCSVSLSTLNLWRILRHEVCVLCHCPPWTCGGSWGTRYVFCVTVHLELVEDPVARGTCSVSLSTMNLWRILRHEVRVLCHFPWIIFIIKIHLISIYIRLLHIMCYYFCVFVQFGKINPLLHQNVSRLCGKITSARC